MKKIMFFVKKNDVIVCLFYVYKVRLKVFYICKCSNCNMGVRLEVLNILWVLFLRDNFIY